MKYEIKLRYDASVLFSLESDSLKLTLEAAVKAGADLTGANLTGADLRGADLRDANLTGAEGLKKFPIQIIGHKHPMCTTQEGQLQIGCHTHSFDEWREIADDLGKREGYDATDIEIYKLHIEHMEKVSKLLWAKGEAQ